MNPPSDKKLSDILHRWNYDISSSDQAEEVNETFLRTAYKYWMTFAKALGKINALVLLTLVYFLLIGPAALVLRILGKDLLDCTAGNEPSYWYKRESEELTIERSKQQF